MTLGCPTGTVPDEQSSKKTLKIGINSFWEYQENEETRKLFHHTFFKTPIFDGQTSIVLNFDIFGRKIFFRSYQIDQMYFLDF